jgi:hypothetical protein
MSNPLLLREALQSPDPGEAILGVRMDEARQPPNKKNLIQSG